ncbi:unnamed protein product [Plasmodium vivax]|uniref:(malaria parasite P. vivax) hypothetical protein n=1 Tax=Plasmodium vivax TaxID=5855 RepID=A0A8S4H9D1_PLAVI|nr:unnamed protein product [Plasmodium vivax]
MAERTIYFDLHLLPSQSLYRHFPDGYGTWNHEEFWNQIEEKFMVHKDIREIYYTLLYGLCYVSYNMSGLEPGYEKRWDFLYYWIGEKIFEKLKIVSKFQDIMHILDDVKLKFDNNIYEYDFSEISKNEFTQLKFIFDYVQDYETIKNTISQANVACSKKLSEHIINCFQEYNILKSKCASSEDKFCQIFNDILTQNGNKELKKITCSVVKDAVLSTKQEESHTGDPPQIIGKEQGNLAERDARGELLKKEVEVDLRRGGEQVDLKEPFEQVPELHSASQDISPDSSRFIGTTTILTSVGILVPFYILKKFTPLGSRLRTLFQKKSLIQFNGNDHDMNENVLKPYQGTNINWQRTDNQIGYYPTTFN